MSNDRGPIPEGIAVGDFWRAVGKYDDAGFVLSIDWNERYEWHDCCWTATFQWLSGTRNHINIKWFLSEMDGYYERVAWGELENP